MFFIALYIPSDAKSYRHFILFCRCLSFVLCCSRRSLGSTQVPVRKMQVWTEHCMQRWSGAHSCCCTVWTHKDHQGVLVSRVHSHLMHFPSVHCVTTWKSSHFCNNPRWSHSIALCNMWALAEQFLKWRWCLTFDLIASEHLHSAQWLINSDTSGMLVKKKDGNGDTPAHDAAEAG